MTKKLKIYLCDLTYDTILLVSDIIPINIGFIGSYINKYLDKYVDIKLFKYPQETIDAIIYSFEFTKEQQDHRSDIFKRYGTDINSLSKIITRIESLESLFRKIKTVEDRYLRDVYRDLRGDNFTRYALVN